MAGDGGIQSKYLVSVTTNGLTDLKTLLSALQSVRDLATTQDQAGMTVVLESDTRGLEAGVKRVSTLTKKEMERAGREGQKELDQALGGRGRGPGKDFSFKVIGGLKPGDVKELRAAITALTIAVDQLPKRIGATGGRGAPGDRDIADALSTSIRTRPTVTKTAARDAKKDLQNIIDKAIEKRASKEKTANQQAKTAAGKLGLTDNELEGLIGGGLNISSLSVGGSNTQSRNVEQAALKARLARARATEARELKKSFDPTVKSLDYFDDKLLNQLIDEAGVRTAFYAKGNNKTKTVKTSNRGLPRYQQSVVTPPASTPSSVNEIGGLEALGRAEGTLSKLGSLLQANVLEPLTSLANIGKELGTAAQELQALRDVVKDETESAIRGSGDAGVRAGVVGPRTYGERRGRSRPLGQSSGLEIRGAIADLLVDSGIGRDDEALKGHAQKIARLMNEQADNQQAAKGALNQTKLPGEFIRTQANRGVAVIDAGKFKRLTNTVENVQKLLFEDARDERGRVAIKAGAPYNESGLGRGAVRPDALRNLAGSIDQVGRLRFQEDALNNLIRGTLDELSGLEVSARKAISYKSGDTSGFAGLPQRAQTFLKLFKTLRTQFDAVRAERRKIDPSSRPSTSALDATEMIAVLNQIGLPQIAKQVDVNFGNQDYEQVARGFKPTADLVTALTSGDDAVISQTFKKLFSSRSKRTVSAQRYAALRSGGTREVLENLGRRVSGVKDLADASSGNEFAQERARSRGVDPAMAQQIVGLADYQLRYLTKVAKEAIDILRPLEELTTTGQSKGVDYAGETGSITDKRAALLKAIRAGGGTKSGAPSELIKAIGDLRRQGAAGFYDNEALGASLGRARTMQREIEPLQKLLQDINTRQASGGDALEGILPALERGGFTTGTAEQRIKALRDRLGGKVGQFGGVLSQLRAQATSAAGAQGGVTALRGDVDKPDAAILGQYQSLVDKNPLFKKLFHIEGASVKTLRENLKRLQEVVKEFENLDKILLGLRNKDPRNFGSIQELAFDIKEFIRASQTIDAARKGDPGVLDPTSTKKQKRYKIGSEPKAPVVGEAAQLVPIRVAKPELAKLERDILTAGPEDRPRLQSQLDRARADQGNYYNQGAGEYIRHLMSDKTLPLERLFGSGGDNAQTAIQEVLSLVERIDPRAAKSLRQASAGFGSGGVTGPGAGIYRDPAKAQGASGLVDVSGIAALRDLDLHRLVGQFGDMAGFSAQISTSFRALRGLDAFLKVLNKEQLAKFRVEMRKMVQDAIKSGAGFGFSTKEEESQRRYEKLSPGAKKLQADRSVAAITEQVRRADEAELAQRQRYGESRAFFDNLKETQEQARSGLTPAIRTPGLLGGPVAPAERKRLLADLNRRYKEAQLIEDKQTRKDVTQGLLAQMSELDPDLSPGTQRVNKKNLPLYRYDSEVENESRRQAELKRRAETEAKVQERQKEDNLARQGLGISRLPQPIPSATTQVASGKSGPAKSVEALLVESQQRGRLREDLKNMLDKTRAQQAVLGNTDVLRGTPATLRASSYRDARTMNLNFDRNEQELKSAGFTDEQRYFTRRRIESDARLKLDPEAVVRQAYAEYRYTPEQQDLESSRIASDRFLKRSVGRRTSLDRRQLSVPVDVERRGGERRQADDSYERFIQKAEREALSKADRRRREEEGLTRRQEKIARDQAFAGFTPQERRDSATRGTLDKYTKDQSAANLYAQGGLFHRAIQEATLKIENDRELEAVAKSKKDAREARQKFFGQLNPEQRKQQLGREEYDRTFGGTSSAGFYASGVSPNYNASVSAEIENQRIERANTDKRKALARQQALREVRQARARKEIDRLAASVPSTVLENTDPIELLQTLGKELKTTARLQIGTQKARTGVALAGPIGGSTLDQAQRGLGRASFSLAKNYAFVDDLVNRGIDTIPGFERFRPDAEQLGQVTRRRGFVESRLNSYTENQALSQAPGLPTEERARAQRNAERDLSALRRAGIKDATDAKRVLQQLTDAEEKHRQVLRKGVADTLASQEADEKRLGTLDTLLDKVRQVSLYAGAGFFVYGLIQGFRQTIKEAIELEAAVTRVQGVLGKGGPEARSRITGEIFQAARDFGTKPAAGAQAYQVFAQAGLEGDDLTRAVRSSLSAEVGAGLEPQQAQELLIAVNALTNGAISFENIIDRISKIEAKYAVSAQDLAVSLQRVGSLAQQLQPNPVGRLDFADLVIGATTQIVEATRVTGNAAATSLRFIFSRLLAPDTAKKLNNDFGVSLYSDREGRNIRPLMDILSDIAKLYQSLSAPGPNQSTARANNLLQVVAGARQSNAAAALFSDFDKVMEVATKSAEAFGSTQQRTALQMETLEKRMAQLGASFASLTAGIFRATGIEGASKLLVTGTAKTLGAAAENPLIGTGAAVGGLFLAGKILPKFLVGISSFLGIISGSGAESALGQLSNPAYTKFAARLGLFAKAFAKISLIITIMQGLAEILDNLPFDLEAFGLQNKHRRQFGFAKHIPVDLIRDSQEYKAFDTLAGNFTRSATVPGGAGGARFTAGALQAEVLRRAQVVEGHFRERGLGRFFPTQDERDRAKEQGVEIETRKDLREAIGKDLVGELKDAGVDLSDFGGKVRDQSEQIGIAFQILRDALKFANFAPTFRAQELQTQTDEDLKKAQETARKSIEHGSGVLEKARDFFGRQAYDKFSLKDFEHIGGSGVKQNSGGIQLTGKPPDSVAQQILRDITGGYSKAFEDFKFPNQFGEGAATFLQQAALVVEQGAKEFADGTKTAGDAFDAVTLRLFTLSREEASRLTEIRNKLRAEEAKRPASKRLTEDAFETEARRRLGAQGDTRAVQVLQRQDKLDSQILDAYNTRFNAAGREGALAGDVHELLSQTDRGRITAETIFARIQAVSSKRIQEIARRSGQGAESAARISATAEAAGSAPAFTKYFDPTGGKRAARSRLVELLGQFQISQAEIQGLGGPSGAFTRAGLNYDVLRERQTSSETLLRGLVRLVPEVTQDMSRVITQIPARYQNALPPQYDESYLSTLDENQRNLLGKGLASQEAAANEQLYKGLDPKTIDNLKLQRDNIKAQLDLLKSNKDLFETLPQVVKDFILGLDQPLRENALATYLIGLQGATRELGASLPQLTEAATKMADAARTAVREREQRSAFLQQDINQSSRLTDITIQGRGTLRQGQQRFADARGRPEVSLQQAFRGLTSEEQDLRLRERTRIAGEVTRISNDETITSEADRQGLIDQKNRELLQSELYITEQVEARRREILQNTYADLLTQQEQGIQAAVTQGTSGFRDVFRTYRGAFPSKDGSGPSETNLLGRLFLPAADQLTGGFADMFQDSLFGKGGLLEDQARSLFGKTDEQKYADLLQSAHEIGIQNGAEYLITAIEQAFAGLGGGDYKLLDDPTKPVPKGVMDKLSRYTTSPQLDTLYSITGRPKGGFVLGPDVVGKQLLAGQYTRKSDQVSLSAAGLGQADGDIRNTISHELGHRLSYKDPQLSVNFRRYLLDQNVDVNDRKYGDNFQEMFARGFADAYDKLDTTRKPGINAKDAYDAIAGPEAEGAPGSKFFVDYLLSRPEYKNHRLRKYGQYQADARPYGSAPVDALINAEAGDEPVFREIARQTNGTERTGILGWLQDLVDYKEYLGGPPDTARAALGNQVPGGTGLDLGTDLMLQSLGYSPYRENRAALGNRLQGTGGTNDTRYLDQFANDAGKTVTTKVADSATKGLFKNPKLNQLLSSTALLGGAFLGNRLGGNNTGSTVGSGFGAQIGSTLTSKSFGGLFSFLGGAAGPVGALAGGVLGGLLGGLFGGKKEVPAELSSLEQIERNTKETYTAINNQAGQLFNLDNRLFNVPASFKVPEYRPISAGGGGGSAVTTDPGTSYVVHQSVEVNITDARDPDAVARTVDRMLKNEIRRGGTYVNKRY